MMIQITARHIDVPDALKTFIESRVQKLSRYIDGVTDIHVTLAAEKFRQVAELNVHSRGGVYLSAREAAEDLKVAVTQAIEKIQGQAKKQQSKRITKKRRRSARSEAQAEGTFNVLSRDVEGPEAPVESQIIESRRFVIKPLTVEEAVLTLEDEKAEFLVFHNAANDRTNVIYRRPDGNFGLIDPER